ncbi:MAG: TolC family protein [Pirellulales bacterium]|nr:TolC family protein [Pirellulales bacterium]
MNRRLAKLLLGSGCLLAAPAWRSAPAQTPQLGSGASADAPSLELLPPAEYIALRQPETIPLPAAGAAALTLQEVESLALACNPTLAQAAAQVRAAAGQQYQVGLPPNPSFGYLGSELGNDGHGGQQGLMVAQDFIRGNKLGLNRAMVGREVERRQQILAAQQRRVLTDVRVAFYDAYLAQRRVELAGKLQTIGLQAAATARALIEAQEGRRTDLLQAEIEGQRATADLAQAESNVRGAWRRLAALVGQSQLPPQALAVDLDTLVWSASWEDTLAELLRDSPEVAEAEASVERARAALARAAVEPIPDVNAQASVQYDDASNYTIAGAQVTMPIPIWNRNQGGVAQAQAELVAARRRADAVNLRLRRDLAEQYQRYEMSLARVNAFKFEILNRAQQNLSLATEGYRAGELAFLDFLIVQRTYFQANLEYLAALGDLNQSVQMLHGLLLAGSYNDLADLGR